MYTDVHKRFLQYLLSHSCVPLKKALCFFENEQSVNDFRDFIKEINVQILNQQLKIALLKCEVTGDTKVVLLNTCNDSVNKSQAYFLPDELEYFQSIINELIAADEHKIKIMSCFNLNDKMNKDRIENLIKKWTGGGYFVQKDVYICLGPRCISEFGPYFQTDCSNYYATCHLCSESVFVGITCNNCSGKLHLHCLQNYLTKQSICPNCKQVWKEADNSEQSSDEN